MSHTYINSVFHYVFSTKQRQNLISPELQEHHWPYMGGIAAKNAMKALIVGGTENHIHLLLSLPATLSVAKAIQLIKGGSSKWIHDTFPKHQTFAWQEGYGAFSVSVSHIRNTLTYIQHQQEHHRKTTFEEEFLQFLQKHNIDYDERYIWG